MINLGELVITWRSSGLNSKIDIHLADNPIENSRMVGEDYLFVITPPGKEWRRSVISIANFEKNKWWQPDNVFDDGKLDINNISRIDIAFTEDELIELDIQSITLEWYNNYRIYLYWIFFYFIVGIILIIKTPRKIITFNTKKNSELSYAGYTRISYLIVVISLFPYFYNLNDISYNFLVFISILLFMILLEDFLPDRYLKLKIVTYRFVFLFIPFLLFQPSINFLVYSFLVFLIYVPVIYKKTRLSFFIILVFLLTVCFFKLDFVILISTIVVSIIVFFIIEFPFFKNKKGALESTLLLYNGIFSHTSDLIYTTDEYGIITSVNRSFIDILNLDIDSFIGVSIKEFIISADHNKLNINRANPKVNRFDTTIGGKNSTSHYVSICENPIYINGLLTGYQVIATDITARKKMEEELRAANKKLKELVNIDGLTGISNRRYFDSQLEIEIRRAKRSKTQLSLIFIDVDYFKLYNDLYGHMAGDVCLQKIAKVLNSSLKRASDITSRYGGEEFVILLPDCDINASEMIAKNISDNIINLRLEHKESKVSEYVTVSMGISNFNPIEWNIEGGELLIFEADKGLYKAKENGRNQFIIFKP